MLSARARGQESTTLGMNAWLRFEDIEVLSVCPPRSTMVRAKLTNRSQGISVPS